MERLYAAPALAVCRAGAITVAELAAAGVPSVLVPWPGAADDQQTDNARVMERGRRGRAAARRGVRRCAPRRGRARAARSIPRAWPTMSDGGARRWPGPMPPTGSPIWSRRRPVPAPEPGPDARPHRAAPHPRRRRRRRGHERVRGDPRRDGPPRERLRPPRAPAPRPAAAARRRVPRAAGRRERPGRRRRGRDQLGGAARRTSRCGPRGTPGIPVLSRADVLAGIVALRRGLGVAGHARQDHHHVDDHADHARGRAAPELPRRQRAQRGRHQRGARLGRVARSSRPTRATARSCGSALEAAIVTNIDHDHLWYWGDMDRLEDAFRRFVDAVDGPVVLCADDPSTPALAADRPDAITYGWADDARVPRVGLPRRAAAARRSCSSATASGSARSGCPVVGRHNAQNAAGAAAMTLELGVRLRRGASARSPASVGSRVASSTAARSTASRSIDDYALLPPEIQATIRAAREGGLAPDHRGVPAVPLRAHRA